MLRRLATVHNHADLLALLLDEKQSCTAIDPSLERQQTEARQILEKSNAGGAIISEDDVPVRRDASDLARVQHVQPEIQAGQW